jgi:hypothetical protein
MMIPDTTADMVLGFAVILGIILVYGLSILIRIRSARRRLEDNPED